MIYYNYKINNIRLENINVPENISEFNGLKIKGVPNDGKVTLKENICKNDFKYGNGDILSKQIEKKSNKNLCVEINEGLDEELFLDFEFSILPLIFFSFLLLIYLSLFQQT